MPAQGRDRGSERRPEPSKGASRNLRTPLNRPNRGETTRFRAIPVANGPRIRPQRPPNRLHPTPIPRRIRLPRPRPGSLRSPRRGRGRTPESALQADACPPSRSPRSHLPRFPATAIVLALVASRPLVLTLIVAGQRLDDLAMGYRGRLDWCTLLLPWRFHGERTYRPVRPLPTLPEVVPAAS